MACRCGKTLGEYLGWPGPVTHRQHAAMLAWEAEEWNQPSRTDYYLMSLTAEVRRLFAQHPGRIQPDDCKLRFSVGTQARSESAERTPTAAEASERSLAIWQARLRGKIKGLPKGG
jgi:hypothetical protein